MTVASRIERNLSESYDGLAAETWDLFGGNKTERDLGFFAAAIRSGNGRALDVTCGSGKHLIPYLQEGLDVEGLDSSEMMLANCRQRGRALGLNPVLYCQMMQAMSLPHKYRTIFISVGSFVLLTDPQDALQTLRKCHEHLEPGGRLYVTAFRLKEAADRNYRNNQTWGPVIRPEDGAEITIRRWTDSVDYFIQVMSEKRTYTVKRHGKIVAEEHAVLFQRWYGKDELVALFESAGFRNVFVHQGFSDAAATHWDDDQIVFRGEK
jgi:SAM-dependent methyltransferase